MSDKTTQRLRFLYGVIVSCMLVICAILLMAACIQIYRSGGEQIYTPEKVAAAFAPIAMPIYCTLVLIAGGFLLALALPTEKKRVPLQKQYAFALRRAYERVDLQLCSPELLGQIRQEQKKRRRVLALACLAWLVGCLIFLPQACSSGNYSQELHLATDSVVALVWWLLPCTLIPTGCSIFFAYYARSSIRRELELVKLAPKAEKKDPASRNPKTLLYTRLAGLGLALGLLVGGFVAGGTADVLAKAVAICTECVGLG